jgi:hypothetical protein
MDHDETKSRQQPQSPDLNGTSSKTPDTLVVPGMQPLKNPIKTAEFAARPGFWEDLRKPAKWVLTFLVPLLVLILIGSGLFNLAKSMFGGKSANQSVPQQATEKPVVNASPSPTAVAKSNSGCADISVRMTQAKVTGVQVDKAFYKAHPDRVGKPLTEADADLKKEWCSIADRLITQKSAR